MASAQRVAASSDELSKFLPELKLRKSELVPPPSTYLAVSGCCIECPVVIDPLFTGSFVHLTGCPSCLAYTCLDRGMLRGARCFHVGSLARKACSGCGCDHRVSCCLRCVHTHARTGSDTFRVALPGLMPSCCVRCVTSVSWLHCHKQIWPAVAQHRGWLAGGSDAAFTVRAPRKMDRMGVRQQQQQQQQQTCVNAL